jgi:hypothetical protein
VEEQPSGSSASIDPVIPSVIGGDWTRGAVMVQAARSDGHW